MTRGSAVYAVDSAVVAEFPSEQVMEVLKLAMVGTHEDNQKTFMEKIFARAAAANKAAAERKAIRLAKERAAAGLVEGQMAQSYTGDPSNASRQASVLDSDASRGAFSQQSSVVSTPSSTHVDTQKRSRGDQRGLATIEEEGRSGRSYY